MLTLSGQLFHSRKLWNKWQADRDKVYEKIFTEALNCDKVVLIVWPKWAQKSSSLHYLLSKLRKEKADSTILWLSSGKLGSHDEDWNKYARHHVIKHVRNRHALSYGRLSIFFFCYVQLEEIQSQKQTGKKW